MDNEDTKGCCERSSADPAANKKTVSMVLKVRRTREERVQQELQHTGTRAMVPGYMFGIILGSTRSLLSLLQFRLALLFL